MPTNPNQQPAPGQSVPLSTERVPSQIPKGGTENETWTYPSPQMFWNALVRKGKAEGAKEEDMDVVVAIHNNMNENTWRAVLEWEKLHQPEARWVGACAGMRVYVLDEANARPHAHAAVIVIVSVPSCPSPSAQDTLPRLSRFMGRPDELSPKAWIKSLFGCVRACVRACCCHDAFASLRLASTQPNPTHNDAH